MPMPMPQFTNASKTVGIGISMRHGQTVSGIATQQRLAPQTPHSGTPIPVPAHAMADNAFFGVFLPVVGAAAAIIAAIAGYLSFRLIKLQLDRADKQIELANKGIALANDQIALGNKQIQLAEQQVTLVIQDLTITREQAELANEERARKPLLVVTFRGGLIERYIRGGHAREALQQITLSFRCHNRGDKEADSYVVFLFFPTALRFRRDYVEVGEESPPFNVSGHEYKRRRMAPPELPDYFGDSIRVDEQLLPGLNHTAGIAWMFAPRGVYTLYYQVRTAGRICPDQGFGALTLYVGARDDPTEAPLDLRPSAIRPITGD